MTHVLVFSTLYPNAAQPNHGVFVENRLRETLAQGGVQATVVAPVPYFPSAHRAFGRYAAFARVPRYEIRNGIEVWHPRYAAIPKVGATLAPGSLFRTALGLVRRLQSEGRRFDVIDAHYFYPDGVAAARLASALHLPLAITGRGTDLTLIPKEAGPRMKIRWAAAEAAALVTVCDDLRQRLLALGAPASRSLVLRNGVDLSLFSMGDRAAARAALRVEGFTLLCVGALIPRKGHELVIRALTQAPDCRLLIAGSGPLRGDLENLARRLRVADRVRFLGEVAHGDLPGVYAAADVLVLASSREGWANVLLEAMACGTPVIASNVNGAAEVVRAPAAGLLMAERTPECLALGPDGAGVWAARLPAARPSGAPPALVLHGFPTCSFDWRLVLPQLQARRDVVLFDFVGFGLSAKPDRRYSLRMHADVTEAVAAHFALTEVDLVTHDIGDSVGGEILRRALEGTLGFTVRRRVMTNGSIYMDLVQLSEGQRLLLALPDAVEPALAADGGATFKRAVAATFADGSAVPAAELDALATLAARDGGLALLPRTIRYVEDRLAEERRFTGAIEAHPSPLSVVWGDADPIAVVAMVEQLRAARPDVQVTILEGVGHYPMLEAPEAFADAVLAGLVG